MITWDKLTPEARSQHMSRIKGKNTKPEVFVRKFLHAHGFRFRLHDKSLPGKPDIKLPKYKTVVFVNGCFWHGHTNCNIYQMPKTRTEFWDDKITKNVQRDRKAISALKRLGYSVIVIWECQLKPTKRERILRLLIQQITKGKIRHGKS